jgi:hypothetical protein
MSVPAMMMPTVVMLFLHQRRRPRMRRRGWQRRHAKTAQKQQNDYLTHTSLLASEAPKVHFRHMCESHYILNR